MVNDKLFSSLLALTVLSLLAGFGFWISNYQEESRKAMAFQKDIEALKGEVLELDRTVLELEVIFCDGSEIDRPGLLRKASERVILVEEQIVLFEKKWGKTSTELLEVKEELASWKSDIISHLGKELEYYQRDQRRLMEVLDSLLILEINR